MSDRREELLTQIWKEQDRAYSLMYEYDSLPHHYGENVLYQSEAHIIHLIGRQPNVTITELGVILGKTTSACSQVVRKLRSKGWVEQTRNEENNRQFNLNLTESGQVIYRDHIEFNRECQELTFQLLKTFTEEELEHHMLVQQKLNEAYEGDVERSKEKFA